MVLNDVDEIVGPYFGNVIAKDLFRLLLGDEIGRGMSRYVYPLTQNRDLVVKFEAESYHFQNVKEWENWHEYSEYEKVSRWLAPCEAISPCGTVLLQKRTQPVPANFEWPEKIPGFLTDTKRGNFGLLDGRLVCHDYANILANPRVRETRADWWEDTET